MFFSLDIFSSPNHKYSLKCPCLWWLKCQENTKELFGSDSKNIEEKGITKRLNTYLMPPLSNSELLTPLAPPYHAGNVQKLSMFSSFCSKVDRRPSSVGSERLSSSWGMVITLRRRWLSLVSQIVLKLLCDVRSRVSNWPRHTPIKKVHNWPNKWIRKNVTIRGVRVWLSPGVGNDANDIRKNIFHPQLNPLCWSPWCGWYLMTRSSEVK